MLAFALVFAMTAMAMPRVLVYTATAGYRHDSIPTAIRVLGQRSADYNVSFVFSEDGTMFNTDTLNGFDGVMFISNSDEVLDSVQQAALQTFFQGGGVYTGVHAASACLFNDSTYQQAVGALFDYHPTIQQATFVRLNDSFPATANVPDRWSFEEEVYQFRSDPRTNGAVVIMTVDENSYTNNGTSTGDYPSQGDPHPIGGRISTTKLMKAWYIENPKSSEPLLAGSTKAGRSFYTSLGHLNETWENTTFQDHVMAGLKWALDGASTRAYGQGLVGNSSSESGTSNISGTATLSISSTGSVTATNQAATSRGAGNKAALTGLAGTAVAAAVGVAAGLTILL